MSDLNDLLKAIITHPDEDVPRLAYADALDELAPVYVACPKCGPLQAGGGKVCYRCLMPVASEYDHHSGEEYDATWVCNHVSKCPACAGTGRVLDTANRDRAEFIRIGCELHSKPCNAFMYSCHENGCPQCECSDGGKYDQLRARERELWNAAVESKEAFKWLGSSPDLFLERSISPRAFLGSASGAGIGVPVLRGFLSSLTCTSEVFLRNADALIWHPEQTVKCDARGCDNGTIGKPRPGDVGGQWMGRTCDKCDGMGRISRIECPPTAQPIREVTLTTWPDGYQIDGLPPRNAWAAFVGSDLEKRYPGVKFHLPPA